MSVSVQPPPTSHEIPPPPPSVRRHRGQWIGLLAAAIVVTIVDAYVVQPGRAADAMFGWTDDGTAFIVSGQTVVSGPLWDGKGLVVTMWWYDPLLVITFTDTTDEGEDLITAVMRGQGLDVHAFDQTDSSAVPADG